MKLKVIVPLLVFSIVAGLVLYWQQGEKIAENNFSHVSVYFKEAGYIESNIEKFKDAEKVDMDNVLGGVVPHHIPTAIPILAEFYAKLQKTKNIDTFIILGPDHFEKGKENVSISKADFITPFGKLSPDLDIINQLEESKLVTHDETPFDDHSIHSQLLLIGKLFPNAKVVPIVFRSSSTNEFAEILGEKLALLAGPNTFIVGSVDFSHYLNEGQARPLDEQSASILTLLQPKLAGLTEADSPQSLVATIAAVKKSGANTSIKLGTYNSADYSNIQDFTTGYVVQFYGVKNNQESFNSRDGTMIFVGDIMLSRSVGALMDKKGDYNLPFVHIAEFLKSVDLTFGNLENPVSSRGVKVGSKYSFRADPKTIEGLKYAGFDIVSIANNHIWDYGREAFLDTMTHLTQAGINFVGGGFNIEEAHKSIIKDINGVQIAFLAYTEFLQSVVAGKNSAGITRWDIEQIKKDIAAADQQSDIVVVSFHWGDEYQTKHNQKQELFAKAAIDAGADLIIGHHPHVVQEVEQYKDGWIAHSLGNFVFDQSFSKETMRGLTLKVKISDGKITNIDQQPIIISNSFQPRLP